MLRLELREPGVESAHRHRESADPVRHARILRRDEVGQALVGAAGRLLVLLPQVVPGHRNRASVRVVIDFDVVAVHARCRVQAKHAVCGDPFFAHDALEHFQRFGVQLARGFADHRIFENLRVRAGKLPGLEERRPVDIGNQLFQRIVAQHCEPRRARCRRLAGRPVGGEAKAPGFGDRQQRPGAFFVPVLGADLLVVGAHAGDIAVALFGREQVLHHAHRAGGIRHINHRAGIVRRDLHRGVRTRGGGAADQQRHREAVALHLLRHVRHFLQRGRDQARQADSVGVLAFRGLQDGPGRHHHPQVHHVVVVALEDHGDDVLADVVHVALDRGDHQLALGLAGFPGAQFFRLDVGQQVRHGLFHHAR